jgi:hypothetical protein
MATIKSYTDISQSKELAKILPHESADMYHFIHGNNSDTVRIGYDKTAAEFYSKTKLEYIPCWSLASLLDVLPKVINNETLFIETSPALWHIGYRNIYTARADNPVDACVEMIITLHEKNLL